MLWTDYLDQMGSGFPRYKTQIVKHLRTMTMRFSSSLQLFPEEKVLVDACIDNVEQKIRMNTALNPSLFIPELLFPLVDWLSKLPTQPRHP